MTRRAIALLLTLAVLASAVPTWPGAAGTALAAAPEGFAAPEIRAVWQRDDGPVASGVAQRTWLWGPGPFYTDYEPYREAPQGNHLVQYFDKGRLEINDPAGDRRSPWFVTSGLLVKEMVTGAAQVGDHEFYTLGPARVPVAGDEGAATATYATFAGLTARTADATGKAVTANLGPAGLAGEQSAPAAVSLAHFEAASGHNWADVFWQFANSAARPAGFDRLKTLGYPITEPYWVGTTIGGRKATVLVQLFERRTLTLNPGNPAATRVEMGNVGRHYYRWRYANLHPAALDARYDVKISVGPAPARRTVVIQTVDFANGTGRPLDSAVFRAVWHYWEGVFTLNVVSVGGKPVSAGQGTRWENKINLRVYFPAPLEPGERTTVAFEFSLKPRTVGGRSAYDRTNDILCLGDMLPTLVPWQNGGWAAYPFSDLGDHGYYATSTYSVQIASTGSERLIVGGTGKIQSVDDARTRWQFAAPNVRDAAYVISPRFADPTTHPEMARQEGSVRVLAYFLPGHNAQAQRQLDLVIPALRWFGRTVGAYPFDTFTVAEMGVPLLRTDNYAQEYPMAYFIPTGWLSLGTTPGTWTWYTPVHETGHQWFYSTVGSNQVTDPWLDEAVTSYMTAEYVRATYPNLYSQVWASTTRGAAGAAKPVSSGVYSGFANENEYSATVYDKAVVMLDRVRRAMGDTAFYAAISDYYAKFRLKQATPQDLLNALQAHSSADLAGIFSAYLGY